MAITPQAKEQIQLVYISERSPDTDEAAINKIKLCAEHDSTARFLALESGGEKIAG